MLLQFAVEKDNSLWICDVQTMQWARVSAPASDPNSKIEESGKLVPQGFGIYALEGRTPKTEGPGAGFSSIGNYVVAIGTTVQIFLRANVQIKDFTMPVPIRQILYKILPTDPQQIEAAIQEVANGDTSQGSAEVAPTPQEPASGGTVATGETATEQPAPEAAVQPRNETVEQATA
jgi:hypothetical protein